MESKTRVKEKKKKVKHKINVFQFRQMRIFMGKNGKWQL